jgi:hypothetical protein
VVWEVIGQAPRGDHQAAIEGRQNNFRRSNKKGKIKKKWTITVDNLTRKMMHIGSLGGKMSAPKIGRSESYKSMFSNSFRLE